MTLIDTRQRTLFVTLLGTAAFATFAASPASAGKGTPAPIVYHGASAPQTTGQATAYTARQPQQADLRARGYSAPPQPAGKAGKRIEFRYPDQPQMVYGNGAARQSANAGPIAFSSSQAAITPDQARQYASVQTPQMSQPKPAHDPAITSGGFDARAAAAAISQNRAGAAVTSEALPALQAPELSAPAPATPPALFDETGLAIVYTSDFNGTQTANGELYDPQGMTAAHPNLPLPSLIHVLNPRTQQEVVVRVNDRGPFEDGANLQLSEKAAMVLGLAGAGKGEVQIKYLGEAPALAHSKTQQYSAPTEPVEPVLAGYAPTPQQAAPAATETLPYAQNATFGEAIYVQLGAFADIANAEYLRGQLATSHQVEVSHAFVRGSDFFRVRVGPFGSRSDAERVRNYISAQGIAEGRIVQD